MYENAIYYVTVTRGDEYRYGAITADGIFRACLSVPDNAGQQLDALVRRAWDLGCQAGAARLLTEGR